MLFSGLFSRKKQNESIILIDISADSVAGAYAYYRQNNAPVVLYTRILPLELRKDEPHERAMLRALGLLGNALITEGAPVLVRETGNGSADMLLVSINAPWQETTVHTETFEGKPDFIFTKNLVNEKMKARRENDAEKKSLVDESIIGTTLNGYETKNPYGKRVHRATSTIITSLIERGVAHDILATLESLFHTRKIFPIAGNSLRYQALENLFPHEKDGIILDATSSSVIDLALLRKGILSTLATVPTPTGDDDAWMNALTTALGEIAKEYPLPRTIFLIARENQLEDLRKKLCAARSMGLWLSDNPPKIVPVLHTLLTENIGHTNTSTPDIVLLLMALYYQKRRFAPVSDSIHTP